MHKTLTYITCAIILFASQLTNPSPIIAQTTSPWTIEVRNMGSASFEGRFEQIQNQIQARIVNPGQPTEMYLLLEIRGIDNGIHLTSSNFYQNYPIPANTGMNLLTVGAIVNYYSGIDLEDLDQSTGISPEVRSYLIDNRRLPAGNYTTCLTVFSVDMPGLALGQSCINMHVTPLSPPQVRIPAEAGSNSAWLTLEQARNLNVVWLHNRAGFTGEMEYHVEIRKFIDVEQMHQFNREGRNDNSFNAMPYFADQRVYNINTAVFNHIDNNMEFEVGDWIAIRVTSRYDGAIFTNNGHSNIVIAALGIDPSVICDNPSITTTIVWPQPGDTVPFRDLHYIVRFDPLCDNLRDFNSTFITTGSGGRLIDNTSATNRWPRGPLTYLRNFGNTNPDYPVSWLLPNNSYAQHLPLIHRVNNDAMPRRLDPADGGYRMGARYTFSFVSPRTGIEQSQTLPETTYYRQSFYTGMPVPRLRFPENDARYRPDTPVQFEFNTGNAPANVLPPFQILRIRGTRNVSVTNPYLNVQEKMVFQVANNRNFAPEHVVVSQLRKLEVNSGHPEEFTIDDPQFNGLTAQQTRPIDQRPNRDYNRSEFMRLVFRDININHTFSGEDTLYWRVVWLQNPETINDISPTGITPDMIYHASEIRRLIITNEAEETERRDPVAEVPGTPGSPSENTPTNCTTPCNAPAPANTTAITDVAGRTQIKVGYFAVTNIERSSSSPAGRITGEGVVTLPFLNNVKIKVELTNVSINEQGELLDGTVKAKEDTNPFNLAAINSDVQSVVNQVPAAQNMNNWLQENFNEGRIVTALVRNEPIGMPIAFDREIEGHELLIGITDMVFSKERATMKLFYEHHFDALGANRYISLRGDVCIIPSGFGGEVMLALNRDFAINDFNAEDSTGVDHLVFKGSSSSDLTTIKNTATHISFKCNCVQSFAIRAEGTLSRETFIKDSPSTPNDTIAKFRFGFHYSRICTDADVPPVVAPEKLRKNNFMLSADFDDFQIRRIKGWSFRARSAFIDQSDLENPEGMTFPAGYVQQGMSAHPDLINTWKGIYIGEIAVKAPRDFYAPGPEDSDARFALSVSGMLIDHTGISFVTRIDNIVDARTGSAGGWAFSIDEFRIEILQNSFRSGSLKGKIALPIQKENEFMNYTALLSFAPPQRGQDHQWGFVMNVNLDSELKMPSFMGKAELRNNSYVAFKHGHVPDDVLRSFGGSQRERLSNSTIAFFIDGVINIVSDDPDVGATGSDLANLATSIGFRGLQFRLGYSDREGFWEHHLSQASPQKYIGGYEMVSTGGGSGQSASGFPISIKSFDLNSDFGNLAGEQRCIGATLSMELEVNLMSESDGGIKASTVLNIPMSYEIDKKRFKLEGPSISKVCIGITTSGSDSGGGKSEQNGITLEGCIEFYTNQMRCGTRASGIKGNLKVGMPMAEVVLAAEFGSTAGDDGIASYRYFYVDGKVLFTQGITLGSIQLMGIGGGFYYNMALNNNTTADARGYNAADMASLSALHRSTNKVDASNTAATIPSSGFDPCPSDGSMVFKLMLPIATAGDPSAFNMDLSVQVGVTRGRGLTSFELIGDGYIMAEINKRNTAPIKADLRIRYEKTGNRDEFNANFDLYVDFVKKAGSDTLLLIEGVTRKRAFDKERSMMLAAHIHLSVEPPSNPEFYIHIGRPHQPGGLQVKVLDILKVQAYHYMQAGTLIDPGFMPLPPLVERILNGAVGSTSGEGGAYGGPNLGEGSLRIGDPGRNIMNASSQLSGFKMGFSMQAEIDLDMFLIYALLELAVGFDLAITNYGSTSRCVTRTGETFSPVGFDGWYTEGQIYAGILAELGLQIKLITLRRFHLFQLGAAVHLQGGFPNPAWAEGRAGVHYSVLGGIIRGNATLKVAMGSKCIPERTDPFGFPIIEALTPTAGSRDQDFDVTMQALFVVPIDEELRIPVLDDDMKVTAIDYVTPIIAPNGFQLWRNNRPVRQDSIQVVWNNDKTICNVTGPWMPSSNVRFRVTVRAVERRSTTATPRLSIVDGRIWSDFKETSFSTRPVPEVIEDRHLSSSMPVKGQRFHLQNAPYARNYALWFNRFGELRSHYFYTSRDGEEYDYIIRFEPFGPGNFQDITSFRFISTGIELLQKPALENNTFYNVNIIRKTRPRQTAQTQQGNLPTIDPRIAQAIGNQALAGNQNIRDILLTQRDFGSGEFRGRIALFTHARQNPPGAPRAWNETVIFSYVFRTSQFNTLEQKLANATASRQIDHSWGEFAHYRIFVHGPERFDRADLSNYQYNPWTGADISTTADGFRTRQKRPLFGIFPDRNNPIWNHANSAGMYWEFKQVLDTYVRNNTSRLNARHSFATSFEVNTLAGQARYYFTSNNQPGRSNWIGGLPQNLRFQQFDLQFSSNTVINQSTLHPRRFRTIDPNWLAQPVTVAEGQREWDIYLATLEQQAAGTSDPFAHLTSQTRVGNGIIPNFSLGNLANLSTMVVFDYDVATPVINDIATMFNWFTQMENATYRFFLTTFHFYRPHMQHVWNNHLTSINRNYYVYHLHLHNLNRNRYSLYNMENRRGIYRFSINEILFDQSVGVSHQATSGGRQFQFRID